jgi:hypothetical protein
MCHERWRSMTRRATLALLTGLCVATAGPGCSPPGQAPNGGDAAPDRLKKMSALRGTGDPRRQGKRPSIPGRQEYRHR